MSFFKSETYDLPMDVYQLTLDTWVVRATVYVSYRFRPSKNHKKWHLLDREGYLYVGPYSIRAGCTYSSQAQAEESLKFLKPLWEAWKEP